jgi:hypothetical protein
VTSRRRTDLALLLIIRRAERDAGMINRVRADEPDGPLPLDEGGRPDPSGSPPPS